MGETRISAIQIEPSFLINSQASGFAVIPDLRISLNVC